MKLKPIFAGVLMFIAAGCAKGGNSGEMSVSQSAAAPSSYNTSSSADYPAIEAQMEKFTYESPAEEYEVMDDYSGYRQEMTNDTGSLGSFSPSLPPSDRDLMFIKTANVQLRSKDFDSDLNSVKNIVGNYGGYFESSNLYTNTASRPDAKEGGYRSYNAVIRIPVSNYEYAKNALESVGVLFHSNESVQEVSGEYFNIKGRLDTAETEEERLLELIEESADIKLLIALEQRLGEVKTQIELYEAHLSQIESKTRFSTVILDMTETNAGELAAPDGNFFTRLGNGFKNSALGTLAFFQGFIVFLAYIIVPALLIAILVFTALFIVKRKDREKS